MEGDGDPRASRRHDGHLLGDHAQAKRRVLGRRSGHADEELGANPLRLVAAIVVNRRRHRNRGPGRGDRSAEREIGHGQIADAVAADID